MIGFLMSFFCRKNNDLDKTLSKLKKEHQFNLTCLLCKDFHSNRPLLALLIKLLTLLSATLSRAVDEFFEFRAKRFKMAPPLKKKEMMKSHNEKRFCIMLYNNQNWPVSGPHDPPEP